MDLTRTEAFAREARSGASLRRWLNRHRTLTARTVSLVVFFGLWQTVGSLTNPILFSTPVDVVKAFFQITVSGDLPTAFVSALGDLAAGYLLAVVVGVAVGVAIGRSKTFGDVVDPYINFMQATPLIAVVPLFVIWLGIGTPTRIVIVFTLAIWSITINTSTGVRATPRVLLDVARIYHLNEAQIVRRIALPNALPHIFAGLRVALGKALIGMVIAEMEVSVVGLGGLLNVYGNEFKTADLLATIVTSSVLGLATATALQLCRARFFPWIAATSAEGAEAE